jgi:hypothetical protein
MNVYLNNTSSFQSESVQRRSRFYPTYSFLTLYLPFTYMFYKERELLVHIPRAQNNTAFVIASVTEL